MILILMSILFWKYFCVFFEQLQVNPPSNLHYEDFFCTAALVTLGTTFGLSPCEYWMQCHGQHFNWTQCKFFFSNQNKMACCLNNKNNFLINFNSNILNFFSNFTNNNQKDNSLQIFINKPKNALFQFFKVGVPNMLPRYPTFNASNPGSDIVKHCTV